MLLKKKFFIWNKENPIWIELFSIFDRQKSSITMKKSILFLLLFCFISAVHASAQERQIVQGYCKDENGKPIENVSAYVYD